MGMAASQARLLSITARIHDVEYQAQSIQNAKLSLATQSDEVYSEYEAALDAQTLTINKINPESGVTSTVAATFNNLFSRNRVLSATGKDYILKDRHGMLVVENDIWNKYQDFVESGAEENPYMFAMYMMGEQAEVDMEQYSIAEDSILNNHAGEEKVSRLQKLHDEIINMLGIDSEYPDSVYDSEAFNLIATEEEKAMYKDKLEDYQALLYRDFAEEIYEGLYDNPTIGFDKNQFNYYSKLFKSIQASGGCISIESYNGLNGDAKNDSEWLKNMVQSGLMTIEIINEDNEGKLVTSGTTPGSDENLGYTTTTKIDGAALAKAEAKYEHAMKEIDKKDKKFDLDLSKLETERTALTTEYDSVKKVIEDNIDRTFGIFS